MSLDRLSKYWPEILSIARIVIGLLFLEHGTAKLFGFPHSTIAQPAMGTMLWFQGIIELVGGALFAVGFLTRHCFVFFLYFFAGPGRWAVDARAK